MALDGECLRRRPTCTVMRGARLGTAAQFGRAPSVKRRSCCGAVIARS